MNNSHPTFASCPKKTDARKTTIVDVYREHFGESLPVDKQYWTMCASQVDSSGQLSYDSELAQMHRAGLISTDQFHGVDIKDEVIKSNSEAVSDAHWVLGDFLGSMEAAYVDGGFNPGIINADFVTMIGKSAPVVSNIMAFLTDVQIDDVLVIANVMATNPYGSGRIPKDFVPDFDEISGEYLRNGEYRRAIGNGNWSLHPKLFYYWGTGDQSKTVMCTYCFIKSS